MAATLSASLMSTTLKNAFNTVTDTVFPGSKTLRDKKRHQPLQAGNDLISNLPLQMALYFNVYFSPFWMVTCIVMLIAKYDHLNSYYSFALVVIYIVMAIVECVRLYLGYVGNLHEKVPELAGFWLLTLMIQLPLTFVLLFNEDAVIVPTERAINIVMATFVVFETLQGYRTIKFMTENQVAKFHLHQFDELYELEEHTAFT